MTSSKPYGILCGSNPVSWGTKRIQHIGLTFISLFIGSSWLVCRWGFLSAGAKGNSPGRYWVVAGVLQTIPSIALAGLHDPAPGHRRQSRL